MSNLISVRFARQAKNQLIRMANEDPERFKGFLDRLPQEDRRELKYLENIANQSLTRSSRLRAEGLFA